MAKLKPIPDHPAILDRRRPPAETRYDRHWEYQVRCPVCQETRWVNGKNIRMTIRKGRRFTGICQSCMHQGRFSPSWKGGRNIAGGYVRRHIDSLTTEQRELVRSMLVGGRWIAEHRLVMAEQLGRPLEPEEIVHHRNGNKLDNGQGNLRLTTIKHHSYMSFAQAYQEGFRDGARIANDELKKEIRILRLQMKQLREDLQLKLEVNND